MKKITAVFNQAGGTGKSTLTQNLAYHLARRGHKTLTIDLDPQGSLTTFMGVDPTELNINPAEIILWDLEKDLTKKDLPILKDIQGVDLIPANLELGIAEFELSTALYRETRLKRILEPIKDDYDHVLMDCPPSLGNLSLIALCSASDVLVPIETQFKAIKGTDILMRTIMKIKRAGNRELRIAGFVPFRYDSRRRLDRTCLKGIQEQLAAVAHVFNPISTSAAMAEAASESLPLAIKNPKEPNIKIFEEIADLIAGKQLVHVEVSNG